MAARLRHGSCHCGAVRFEATVDLALGTIRCNCTLCAKQRNWSAIVARADFRLVAGAQALSTYRCATRTEAHLFCATCGIRTFGTGTSPRWGEYVAVSVACLDDATDAELAGVPVACLDGRNDAWEAAPREVRHL
ncbi:GFA family protein [uncultured Massilia sp.]|uniref:GFA family protein n=1 Tax=uncultured Massilia sp. TaxID=169973 RepID=UPI0025D8FCCE|nr:GFA family protein [uncultured Massilia sp.]